MHLDGLLWTRRNLIQFFHTDFPVGRMTLHSSCGRLNSTVPKQVPLRGDKECISTYFQVGLPTTTKHHHFTKLEIQALCDSRHLPMEIKINCFWFLIYCFAIIATNFISEKDRFQKNALHNSQVFIPKKRLGLKKRIDIVFLIVCDIC